MNVVDTTTAECQAKMEEVYMEQTRLGMEPRADSRLTVRWANGDAEPEYQNAWQVAHELVITDQIYKTTLYGEIIEEVMRNVAGFLRKKYRGLTWTDTWDIVRFYVPTMLKIHCLIISGQISEVQR
jgi:hypothetical protein